MDTGVNKAGTPCPRGPQGIGKEACKLLLGCRETSDLPEARGHSANAEKEHLTHTGVGAVTDALLEKVAFGLRPNGVTGIRG